jgi:peptidoglycan/xylan/chitin deacetylase (PgdA/CDA1 family)
MPPLRLVLWLSSLLGIVVGVRALGGAPFPLALCLGAFALHASLATVGVLLPSLGVFADVIARGPRDRPELALTFDDGPHPDSTRRVLEILREHGARATFFVLGSKAARFPELVREIAAAGHAVGVHGHEHDRLYALRSTRFVARDLERASAAIEAAMGVRPTLFRPPVGFVSPSVAVAAERAGLVLVGWSARTLDGRGGSRAERVLARATAALENGAILVLHDAAERDDHVPASLAVLGAILERLRERGLSAVTVDALRRPV